MKKLILAVALTSLALAGCTTTGKPLQPVPPALLVAQLCPQIEAVNTVIATFPGVSPKVLADLALVNPLVEAVCSNGATLQIGSVDALLKTGLPLLLDVVAAAPIPGPQQESLRVGIALAEALLPQLEVALAAGTAQ